MKVYLILPMALASIAFAVAGTSTGDMSTTTFMEQNVDLPVNGSARIIHGGTIRIRSIGYHCGLRTNRRHTCSCTILNKDFILTAANCVTRDPTSYSVVVGTSSLQRGGSHHMVKTINIHPTFSYPKGDIAVLKLRMSINMTLPNRKAVVLATTSDKLADRQPLFVYGWGITRNGAKKKFSNRLRHGVLRLKRNRLCRKYWSTSYITSKVFCASGLSTTCLGDSGGALMAYSDTTLTQFGIASFQSSPRCNALPAVFTKVSAYYSWIKEVAGC